MRKIVKLITGTSVATTVLIASFLPILSTLKARALSHGSGDYELSVSVDSNADWVAAMTVDGTGWDADDTYLSTDNEYYVTIELHVPNDKVREVTSVRSGGDSGPYEIQQAGNDEDWYGTHRKFTYTINYQLPENVQIGHLSLNPYSEDNNGGPDGPEPQGNAEAVLRVRGGEGSFDDSIYDRDNNLIEERTVSYADTYHEGSYALNGGWFYQLMPEDAVEGENYSQIAAKYDDDPESDSVRIGFAALWHMKYEGVITINEVDYPVPVDYGDQVSYLEHYGGQMVTFEIEVPKAENNIYDITVRIGKNNGQGFIGNFLWTADPEQQWEKHCDQNNLDENGEPVCEIIYDEEGNPVPGRDYIGHSSLTLLEVAYTVGDTVYHCNAREGENICAWWPVDNEEAVESCNPYEEDCNIPYIEFDSGDGEYDDGSLVIPAGARVTMQVIPDYGYQVMNVNMAELTTTDDGVGEFTFTVPAGAAYFVADVVPVEDVVSADTDLVTSGSINLGAGQTTLGHGTARLEVKDVDLTEENIALFEDAASDYNIKNFLDISLYNVTCKGATTCTGTDEDSWNERVRDLNEPATITLQLEDGVDGNEIVIVHEKHDGTYEIIPTEYDPDTHTITFATTSFSNYAIASRTVAPETGRMTNTEDVSVSSNTLSVVILTVVATMGVAIAGALYIKRDR